MSRTGILLALAGLALAILLLAQQDLSEVAALLGAAGFGLVLAALAHIPSMAINGHAWGHLLPGARPGLATLTAITWIRESVNGLLPVARIGGEVVSYRLLRLRGVGMAPAAASLLADVAVSVLSQLAFTLLGVALLLRHAAGIAWGGVALGLAVGIALGIGFVLVQRHGLLGRAVRALDRMAAGRLGGLVAHSARIDAAVEAVWRRRRAVLACFAWQILGWAAGALQIWLALRFLGAPVDLLDAVAIEALIQAVGSAAFVVPGALGVQEGGFLAVGALVGLDPATAAALALSRRLRDLVVFLPGLAAWAWMERGGGSGMIEEPRP